MDIIDIIQIIYFMIPLMAFIFGMSKSVEEKRECGKRYNTSISKNSGIVMLIPSLVQSIPMFLIDISQSFIWRCLVFIVAVGLLIFLVPRNFRTGYDSTKETITEYIKEYQFTCLKIFSLFTIGFFFYKFVISKWFEYL